MKTRTNYLSLMAAVIAIFTCFLFSCGNSHESETAADESKQVVNYGNAESFEAALNAGENLEGKIVQFTVRDFHPDSTFGYNLVAGKHLNFVSSRHPNINIGDIATVKATTIESYMKSWIINYEKVENAVVNDDTILSYKATTTVSNQEQPSSTTTSKPQIQMNGFDESRNQRALIGGVDWQIPYYLELKAQKPKDRYSEYREFSIDWSNSKYPTKLIIASMQYTDYEDNSEQKNIIEQELVDDALGIVSDSLAIVDQAREDIKIAGLSGGLIEYEKKGNDEIVGCIAYAYNPAEKIIIIVRLQQPRYSGKSITDDFIKMIESATIVNQDSQANEHTTETTVSSLSEDDIKDAVANGDYSLVTSEFKQMMDEYERFYDDYITFVSDKLGHHIQNSLKSVK